MQVSNEKKREIFETAMKYSFKAWNDVLDCEISIARRKYTKESVEELYERLAENPENLWYTVYLRKNFDADTEPFYEFAVSTKSSDPVYYIWLYLSAEDAVQIIDKCKLY